MCFYLKVHVWIYTSCVFVCKSMHICVCIFLYMFFACFHMNSSAFLCLYLYIWVYARAYAFIFLTSVVHVDLNMLFSLPAYVIAHNVYVCIYIYCIYLVICVYLFL